MECCFKDIPYFNDPVNVCGNGLLSITILLCWTLSIAVDIFTLYNVSEVGSAPIIRGK
jgi:hypothetical protein